MLSSMSNPPTPASMPPPWVALLEFFYARLGRHAPGLQELEGDRVPPPYRSLLVHSCDMTPTLEAFYHQPIALKVLSRELQDHSYLREVLLQRSDTAQPVEYGVIRVNLNHLPPAGARRVLEGQHPFGNILKMESIAHLSWPQAFFRVESDPHMGELLALAQPRVLFGRRNVLVDGHRRLLAEVIEILAPVPAGPAGPDADGY
jgi:chorismate-pyruvate lyase